MHLLGELKLEQSPQWLSLHVVRFSVCSGVDGESSVVVFGNCDGLIY